MMVVAGGRGVVGDVVESGHSLARSRRDAHCCQEAGRRGSLSAGGPGGGSGSCSSQREPTREARWHGAWPQPPLASILAPWRRSPRFPSCVSSIPFHSASLPVNRSPSLCECHGPGRRRLSAKVEERGENGAADERPTDQCGVHRVESEASLIT